MDSTAVYFAAIFGITLYYTFQITAILYKSRKDNQFLINRPVRPLVATIVPEIACRQASFILVQIIIKWFYVFHNYIFYCFKMQKYNKGAPHRDTPIENLINSSIRTFSQPTLYLSNQFRLHIFLFIAEIHETCTLDDWYAYSYNLSTVTE